MKKLLAVTLAAAMLPIFVQAALAQNLEEIFRKASPTVLVVRSKGRDVGAGGVTRFKTVAQDSMAWKMGLQGGNKVVTIGGKEIAIGGDVILSVDDIPVVSEDNIEQIRNKSAGVPRGTPFKMSVLRAGKVLVLTGTTQGASK